MKKDYCSKGWYLGWIMEDGNLPMSCEEASSEYSSHQDWELVRDWLIHFSEFLKDEE